MRDFKSKNNFSVKKITLISIFMAIILIQTWIPFLGYIAIPPLNITIIHVTVILASLVMGGKTGAFIGFFWGLNSLIRAYTIPSSPMYIYIFSSPLVSVLPRFLMPVCLMAISSAIKNRLTQANYYRLMGLAGALLNTILVLSAIVVFKRQDYLQIQGASMANLWSVLMGIILVNGIPEAIFSAFVMPLLMRAVKQII